MYVEGKVLSTDGSPISGAIIETWETNGNGAYSDVLVVSTRTDGSEMHSQGTTIRSWLCVRSRTAGVASALVQMAVMAIARLYLSRIPFLVM